MAKTKVCPCVDCGDDVEVHIYHSRTQVRCPEHRKAARKRSQRDANRRWKAKKKPQRKMFPGLCEGCGDFFKSPLEETRFCSKTCANTHVAAIKAVRKYHKPCIACGVEVEVHPSVRVDRVRCPKHKAEHKAKLKRRYRISRKNAKKVEPGKAPYEDYVVVGPTWSSQPDAYGWRVTAKHKSNSNRREMSLAHYRMSVKLGRRVQDREEITFLDGNVDNCLPENLALAAEHQKKEVA